MKQNLKNALIQIGGAILLGAILWLVLTIFGVVK